MARRTLGQLMGREGESESQVAAVVSKASDQEPGLNVPFEPKEDILLRSIRGIYAFHLLQENSLHPPRYVLPHPPGLETGILSTEGTSVFTSLERFEDSDSRNAVQSFNEISRGSLGRTEEGLSLAFERLAKNSIGVDLPEGVMSGHDLLASEGSNSASPQPPKSRKSYTEDPHYANVDPESRPIASAVVETLKQLNKYTPTAESPYLDYQEKGELAFTKGLYSVQRDLGEFNKDAVTYSVTDLRRVATEMLLRAQSISRERAYGMAKDFASKGGFGSATDLMILLPHMTQIGGGKVSVNHLRARVRKGEALLEDDNGLKSAQDDLLVVQHFSTTLGTGEEDPHVSEHLNTALNASSYGTMSSPAEPFNGAFPAGMAMPVLYAIITVGLFGQFIFPLVISGMKSDSGDIFTRDPHAPHTLSMGRSYETSNAITSKILELFGMPRTNGANFFGSIMGGTMLFFGIQAPIGPFDTFGADALDGFLNLLYGPGFYLVMVKGILRDIAVIGNTLQNFQTESGIFGMITSFFTSLEVILQSYTFKFLMIMAQTGAQAARYRAFPGLDGHGGQAVTYDKQKEIRQLRAGLRHSISRFHQTEDHAISPLSLMTHPASLLRSPGLNEIGIEASSDPESQESLNGLFPLVAGGAVNRISPEMLEAIESKIESEYVPFSIQDLRTNEVFGLPAFIVSLSDDFSVQHGSSHGYGRTDPVFTHSKTTRSINLVFNLVSMNRHDHDYMYHIVNKIVAMCYPQRDLGLVRKKGDQFFVQPFSQTPTSSPVIRS